MAGRKRLIHAADGTVTIVDFTAEENAKEDERSKLDLEDIAKEVIELEGSREAKASAKAKLLALGLSEAEIAHM